MSKIAQLVSSCRRWPIKMALTFHGFPCIRQRDAQRDAGWVCAVCDCITETAVLPALGCFPGLGHLCCSGRQTQSPGRNEAVGVMPASPED